MIGCVTFLSEPSTDSKFFHHTGEGGVGFTYFVFATRVAISTYHNDVGRGGEF